MLDDIIGGTSAGGSSGPLTEQLQALTNWIPPDRRLWVLGGMIAGLVALKTVLLITNTGVQVWISTRLGLGAVSGFNLPSLVIATAGALLLLFANRKLRGKG